MAKAREELGKMFKTFSSNFDFERLEKFIEDSERMMRRPAGLLLAQAGLDASTSKPFSLLDHACGTGPIAAHLQENVDKQVLSRSKMVCADISDNLVGTLKKRAEKHKWVNVETAILDAQNSGLPEQSFSHVTMNFAMHVIPDPGAVLQEVMRVLQPGGTLAFTVWHKDNSGWVPDMRSSFEALPFDAPMPSPMPMAPNSRPEFIDPDLIPEQLRHYGFEDVDVRTAEHIVRMESADDYLRTFEMMKDWMMQAYWSEESKEKAKGMLDDHIVSHLTEKHKGQGWDLSWTLILATCRKPSKLT
ncbi:S-adenosyl-L-methionine-dependent methyltransferase [Xylaria sp. FL1777]|nr:S-adenosyl-L-methionine-dependent methyltransferase [Xylaria sp. FL1777]